MKHSIHSHGGIETSVKEWSWFFFFLVLTTLESLMLMKLSERYIVQNVLLPDWEMYDTDRGSLIESFAQSSWKEAKAMVRARARGVQTLGGKFSQASEYVGKQEEAKSLCVGLETEGGKSLQSEFRVIIILSSIIPENLFELWRCQTWILLLHWNSVVVGGVRTWGLVGSIYLGLLLWARHWEEERKRAGREHSKRGCKHGRKRRKQRSFVEALGNLKAHDRKGDSLAAT